MNGDGAEGEGEGEPVAGDTCDDPIPLSGVFEEVVTGDLLAAGDDVDICPFAARDLVYVLDVRERSTVVLFAETDDPDAGVMLTLRPRNEGCVEPATPSDTACATDGSAFALVVAGAVDPGVYFVIVESVAGLPTSGFTLTVLVAEPVCVADTVERDDGRGDALADPVLVTEALIGGADDRPRPRRALPRR